MENRTKQPDNPRSEKPQPGKGESTGIQQREGAQGVGTYGGPRREWMSSPFSFMRRFSEEMDRLFEDFGYGGGLLARSTGGEISPKNFGRGLWRPPIEVIAKGEELVVKAELPGLSKEDIKVECTDDEVIIQGERRQEHKEEYEGGFHTERTYGKFFRRVPLPEGTRAEEAKAVFRDGILEITMKAPKQPKPATSREISIGE